MNDSTHLNFSLRKEQLKDNGRLYRGKRTTIFLPAFPGRLPALLRQKVLHRRRYRQRTPSVFPIKAPSSNASSFFNCNDFVIYRGINVSGDKTCTNSWILCAPATPVESTADVAGSTATTATSGIFRLQEFADAAYSAARADTCNEYIYFAIRYLRIFLGLLFQKCAWGFTGFTNCPGIKLSGISFCKLVSLCDCAFHTLCAFCQLPSSAPYAFMSVRRSCDMVSRALP